MTTQAKPADMTRREKVLTSVVAYRACCRIAGPDGDPLAVAEKIEAMHAFVMRAAVYLQGLYDNMLENDADMMIDKSESPMAVAEEALALLASISKGA